MDLISSCMILNIVISWYSKLTEVIRRSTALSDILRVRSGIRQGGVLSPSLLYLMFMLICSLTMC